MAAEALAQVLRPLQQVYAGWRDENLLVGLEVPDDAAVYRLAEDQALVVTTDFFTPVVDDPYTYGAIAAANSLSDLYAMGARPLVALNIAALPKTLPRTIGAEILRGGAEKAREAGIVVAGGHTVQDNEPKYGLVAIGLVHPQRFLRKSGARPGDRLLLSKPLGTGVVTTGLKRDLATAAEVEAAVASMLRLNATAAAIALAYEAHAATDVTGFGLLGHAVEMAQQGRVGFRLAYDRLPWLPGARRLGAEWVYPGGAHDNRRYFGPHVRFDPALAEWEQVLCFSPETSGGLLLALASDRAQAAQEEARARGQELWDIGEVSDHEGIEVVLSL